MLIPTYGFDEVCGTVMTVVRASIGAYVTAFNFLDPFGVVRAASQAQRNIFGWSPA